MGSMVTGRNRNRLERRPGASFRAVLAVLGVAGLPHAYAEGWRVSADLTVSETYTDNADLSASAQAQESDWVTEITPGLRVTGNSARASGDLNLRLQGIAHTAEGKDSETRLGLFGVGRTELVDDRLFVDGAASISRERVSQFGATNVGDYQDTNTTEIRRFNFSPYARWRLGDQGLAILRYRADFSDSDDSLVDERVEQRLNLNAQNGTAWGRLGWGLVAEQTRISGERTRTTEAAVMNLSLFYSMTPTLRLEIIGGRERNNYLTAAQETYQNYGGGVTWTPQERTLASARINKRWFGWGRDYRVRHAMRRVIFEVGYVHDAETSTTEQSLQMSQYDLLNTSLMKSEPDPYQRFIKVMTQLVQQGISPFDLATVNFLANTYTDSRRLFGTITAQGVRNTVSLNFQRADRSALYNQTLGPVLGDFSTYSTTRENRGYFMWSNRYSPIGTAYLGLEHSWVRGDQVGTGAQDTRRTNSLDLGWNTTLGAYTRGGLRYRYSRSTGTAEYRENSLAATLYHAF